MQKLWRVLIAVVLITGTGAAAVTNLYGAVIGSTEAEGPVLYAGPNNALTVNDLPASAQEYVLDGSGLFFNSEQFNTERLEEPDFYPITANMYAETRLNTSGSEPLELEFGFFNATDNYQLCTDQIQVQYDTYKTYDAVCNATVQPENVQYFYYKFNEQTRKNNISYHILADGTTRIEVAAQ